MNTAILALSISLFAGTTQGVCDRCTHPGGHPQTAEEVSLQTMPKVEVVFVLDTTGSMGGLIESAKEKIWSIATTIAQAQPSPEIRMGLVAYRDRGDDYITSRTPMTDDLDALYSELTGFEARGGGDGPESVNQALFEGVERFDWTEGEDVLRIVYLVGDAPPKMKYTDDVKYPATCKLAREKGIFINTIQCGSMHGTKEVWQEIAQGANGAYAAIAQDGGTQSIATPYDEEITQLDLQLTSLMIDYGDEEVLRYQHSKRGVAKDLSETAAPEAAADRAVYNQSMAGRANLYGRQELVDDYVSGKVKLGDVPAEHLPEELRGKPEGEIAKILEENHAKRLTITVRLQELAIARRDYQSKELAERPASGFDAEVVEILSQQAAMVGLTIRKAD